MPMRPREENIFDSFDSNGGGWVDWQPSQIESYSGGQDRFDPWQESDYSDYYVPQFEEPSRPSSRDMPVELESYQTPQDLLSQMYRTPYQPEISQNRYVPEEIQPELQWKPTITGGQYSSATASPADIAPFEREYTSPFDLETPRTPVTPMESSNMFGGFTDPGMTAFNPSNYGTQFDVGSLAPPLGPLRGPWDERGPFDYENIEPIPSQALNPNSEFYAPRAGSNLIVPSPGVGPQPADIGGLRRGQNPLYQFTPETAAAERFNQLLAQHPDPNPGWARSILAALGGFSMGPKAADEIQYGPYRRDVEAWKNQVGPAQQAATLERQYNTEQRQALYQQEQAKTAAFRAESQARNETAKNELAKQKLMMPNVQFHEEGEYIIAEDKNSGAVWNTGVLTTNTNKFDLAVLNGQIREQYGANRDTAAAARQQAQITANSALQTQRDIAAMDRLITNAANKAKTAASGGSLSPTQQKVQRHLNANDVIAEFPEYEANGNITIASNGDVILNQGNLSPEEFGKIQAAINGSIPMGTIPTDIDLPPESPTGVGSTPQSKPIGPGPNAPPGTPENPSTSIKPGVPVTAPDGNTYSPPPGKVVAYNKLTGQYVYIVPDNRITNGENATYRIIR